MSSISHSLRRRSDVLGRDLQAGPGRWPSRGRRQTLAWLAPGILAAVYGVVVVANLRPIVTAINMDSDAVVAPVIAQLLRAAPAGSHVALGNHPWYEALLFLRATSGLPDHRELWDVAPALWSLAGLAILGWCAWRSLGRHAAVLTVSALACLGSFGRFVFFTFIWHGITAVHTIVVCAALVWVTPRLRTMSWSALVSAATALGAFDALALASDDLLAVWALLPLVGTALLSAWRTSGPERVRMPAFALLSTGVSVVAAAVIGAVMRANGYAASPFPVSFVAAGHLIGNVVLLIESYAKLAGGDFFGAQLSGPSVAEFVSGTLLITALVLVLVEVRRRTSGGASRSSQQRVSRRFAYVSFWAMSLVLTSAAFLLSSAPEDPYDARYLLGGYVALGALLPLLAERSAGWRVLVTGGVCVFGLSAICQVVNQPFAPGSTFPGPQDATALVRFARQEDVSLGYAGYWDAADLTWGTHFEVTLYPTWECASAHRLCTFPWVGIFSWYRPRPWRRSMLVLDSSQPGVRALDRLLGRPLASMRVGDLTVYAFSYDIAAELIPARLSPVGRVIVGPA